MDMTIKDIRESGLLELYVLGDLSPSQIRDVESALSKFPELKYDISEIESALFVYSKAHAIDAPSGVLDNILKDINQTNTASSSTSSSAKSSASNFNWLFGLLTASLILGGAYFWNASKTANQELESLKEECDQLRIEREDQLNMYAQVTEFDNQIVKIAATDKYPTTQLTLFTNDTKKKNFIQILNLPELSDDLSYQLWSLKPDSDPIPLDVFSVQNSQGIFEVLHEEGSNAYAITIEPKGGSQSPNLENLIGVFSLPS